MVIIGVMVIIRQRAIPHESTTNLNWMYNECKGDFHD